MKWLVVGISGATCSGKTTLAQALHSSVPGSILLQQDDYFLPPDSPQHTFLPELHHNNWEISTALDMDAMVRDVQAILAGGNNSNLLILEGFLILNDDRLSKLCHLKFYLTLTREQCLARRSARVYDPPDPPGYFELCVWPEYEKHRELALNSISVTLLDGSEDAQNVARRVERQVCHHHGQVQLDVGSS